jgi:hypothetical protein
LLEGLEFPLRGGEAAWTSRDTWLLRRLHELERAGQRELVLDEEALKALERRDAPPLPDAFSVFAAVAAPSTQSLEEGHFRIRLDYACGPSGAVLLGRFCHADARLLEQVRLHLRAEERLQPEAVFAEIAHLPAGRAGNILLRPLLREYEIPYLGGSGAPPEQQIPLEDLRVSVRGERVLLRSARLGRQVLPRLTAAHNFQNDFNTGTYRFLCALQTQGVAATLAWSWGPLAQAPFLPRVRAGRLVLSRARWRLGRKELRIRPSRD